MGVAMTLKEKVFSHSAPKTGPLWLCSPAPSQEEMLHVLLMSKDGGWQMFFIAFD